MSLALPSAPRLVARAFRIVVGAPRCIHVKPMFSLAHRDVHDHTTLSPMIVLHSVSNGSTNLPAAQVQFGSKPLQQPDLLHLGRPKPDP
jgi:hypothetical protein